jgi:hypothetical protein
MVRRRRQKKKDKVQDKTEVKPSQKQESRPERLSPKQKRLMELEEVQGQMYLELLKEEAPFLEWYKSLRKG